jgi:spore germination protein YaaH
MPLPRVARWLALLPGLVCLSLALLPLSAAAQVGPARRVLGYYVPYDPASWAALRDHAGGISLVGAQWVTVDPCGNLTSRDDRSLQRFAQAHGIGVLPSLLTTSSWLNHRLLTELGVAAQAVGQIVEYVTSADYAGFDLDLEGVDSADREAYSRFVGSLGAALHQRGKLLALALPPKTRDTTSGWAGAFDYAALGQQADLLTIMAYEYSGPFSGPGSIAPYDQIDQVLAYTTSQVPAEKVLLGLAFYGYDWDTTTGRTRALSYGQAACVAARYNVPIGLDPASRSAVFRYQAAAGEAPPAGPSVLPVRHRIGNRQAPPCPIQGPAPAGPPVRPPLPPTMVLQHEVWLEESASAAARLSLAERYRVGGVAMWRLGIEDPKVWPFLQPWRGRG